MNLLLKMKLFCGANKCFWDITDVYCSGPYIELCVTCHSWLNSEEAHCANFLNIHLPLLGKPKHIRCSESLILISTRAQSSLMCLQTLRVSYVSLLLPLRNSSAASVQELNWQNLFYFWMLAPHWRWKNNRNTPLKYLSCLLLLSESLNISFLLCFFWVECTFVRCYVCEDPHNLKPKISEASINFKIIFFKASHL